MKFTDLIGNLANRTKIFPSTSDIVYTVDNNVPQHIVHTPYQIDPATGNVFNPSQMRTVVVSQGQPLKFLIERNKFKTKPIATIKQYEGELTAMAGSTVVWQGRVSGLSSMPQSTVDIA